MCNERACLGSVMAIPGRGEIARNPEEVLNDAKDFLGQYFASIRRLVLFLLLWKYKRAGSFT